MKQKSVIVSGFKQRYRAFKACNLRGKK